MFTLGTINKPTITLKIERCIHIYIVMVHKANSRCPRRHTLQPRQGKLTLPQAAHTLATPLGTFYTSPSMFDSTLVSEPNVSVGLFLAATKRHIRKSLPWTQRHYQQTQKESYFKTFLIHPVLTSFKLLDILKIISRYTY